MASTLNFVSFADRRPRLNTALRSLLAIFGGYGLAALTSATLALALPLARVDAVMAATMIAFFVYLLAVIWAFATATLARAFGGLLLPAGILAICFAALPKGVPA
ncbi:iron transporter [Propionivibrio limicola]|uniref:iron transporter n=1 Tax=Propionivibrio limicola TaxID=167645 RepID=UPI001290D103|nr:iron transporter [Propionivibrio limicola]